MKIIKGNADDSYLKKWFSYLAKYGFAPKFGSTNISDYQCRQIAALNRIEKEYGNCKEIRIRKNHIEYLYRNIWIKDIAVKEFQKKFDLG